jgi:hypothetical protein
MARRSALAFSATNSWTWARISSRGSRFQRHEVDFIDQHAVKSHLGVEYPARHPGLAICCRPRGWWFRLAQTGDRHGLFLGGRLGDHLDAGGLSLKEGETTRHD